MFRPFLSTAFCFIAAFSFAYTDGDWSFNYSGSTATITGYSGSSAVVTIPSTVTRTETYQEMDDEGNNHTRYRYYHYTVTSIGNRAFAWCNSITSVTIPNSVTSIGDLAFYERRNLMSVTIGNGVKNIGIHAFVRCSNLTSVTIPNSVTNIGDFAFYECSGLSSVTIGSGVRNVGIYAFVRCSNLTSVTIPNSVTNIGDFTFYECSGLSSVTIGSGVRDIGIQAFHSCSNLTSVTVPNSVTNIGDFAFYECSGLSSVTIGSGVRNIGIQAFHSCSNLTFVTIPNSVTNIGDLAFYQCCNLTSVAIPASVMRIGNEAFAYDIALMHVWFNGISPTTGISAFSGVALGARGHYPPELAAQWLPQIGSDGKWNGLIMHDLSQPVLSVKSANPAEGSITLAWDDGTDRQCVSSYSIYRGPGPERLPEYFVEDGITDTEWTDDNYWNAEPVLSPLNYWVVAESDYFDLPESNAVETRHRYALAVGCDQYSPNQRDRKTLQRYAPVPENKAEAEKFASLVEGFTSDIPGQLTGTLATKNAILSELARFAGKAQKGDLFFFFVSTHGGDTVVDEETGEERSAGLMVFDGDFSAADVAEGIGMFDSDCRIVCIFSSCFAAHMTDMGAWASAADMERLSRRGLAYCPANVSWIGSSSFGQYSLSFDTESSEFGHWFLTRGWEDGCADARLTGTDSIVGNGDGRITLTELASYAREYVRGISDDQPSTVFIHPSFDMDDVVLVTNISEKGSVYLSAPSNVRGEENDSLQGVFLSWNSVADAEIYRVFRRSSGDTGPGTCVYYNAISPSFIDTPPTAGAWEYAVAAVSRLAVGPRSGFVEATANNYGDITLYFNDGDVEGEGKTAGICVAIGNRYGSILEQPERDGFRFLGWYARKDGKLVTPDSIVRVEDAEGLEAFWGKESRVCAASDDLRLTAARVSWASESEATAYFILRSTDENPLEAEVIGSTDGCTSFTDSTVEEGISYHYWIAPISPAGIGALGVPSSVLIRPKTKLSPEPVLHEWLDSHLLVSNGDYEAAAMALSANGGNMVWECYVAGISPTNSTSTFQTTIMTDADGKPVVSWSPDLNENGTKQEREYRILGAKSLGGAWDDVTDTADPDAEGYRFFKATVRMP